MFITFEGGEGAGKTTQIKKLSHYFQEGGHAFISTREPGGTKLGEHIRHCLLNPEFGISFGFEAELLLFLAARAQHLEEIIKPALSEGKIVICDRYNDSSIAYQGGGRQLGIERVLQLCALATNHFEPDLTFLLDIDPVAGMGRIQRKRDRLEEEHIAFHHRVRQAFLEIAHQHTGRFTIINANDTPEAVFAQIIQTVEAAISHGG